MLHWPNLVSLHLLKQQTKLKRKNQTNMRDAFQHSIIIVWLHLVILYHSMGAWYTPMRQWHPNAAMSHDDLLFQLFLAIIQALSYKNRTRKEDTFTQAYTSIKHTCTNHWSVHTKCATNWIANLFVGKFVGKSQFWWYHFMHFLEFCAESKTFKTGKDEQS